MDFYNLNEIPEHLKCYFEQAPQIGLEETPEQFVQKLVEVFREVRRVLRDDGTLWLNLGDSYSGSMSTKGAVVNKDSKSAGTGQDDGYREKPMGIAPGLKAKDMIGIPWRVAFALQADGWYLRSDIIWAKRNCMPESVTDRPTKAHEYIFLLTKSPKYFYDADAIREPASGDEDRKTFRGGGKYTAGQSFDNSLLVENETHGNKKKKPNKQDATGNPTYIGFNEPWKGKHSTQDPQSAGARIGISSKRAREETGSHDGMFGITRNKRTVFVCNDKIETWTCAGLILQLSQDNPELGSKVSEYLLKLIKDLDKPDVWWINPQPRPDLHFATFPDELAETCIKAGTSEYGCCPKCGAPWKRIVEATGGKIGESWHPHENDGVTGQKGFKEDGTYRREFKGWQAGCKCDAGDPVPCVVLDPFMGSGTVAVVARELNRSSVGCELNPEYVKIIRKRLNADSQLDTGIVEYQFEVVREA